jgi:hypothetical protein
MKCSITCRLHCLTSDKHAVLEILIFQGASLETQEPDYFLELSEALTTLK